MASEASISVGKGGTGPLTRMSSLGTSETCWTACCSGTLPVSTELRPTFPLMLNRWCTVGRRRSASMSRTRTSRWARTQARFMATVVLPSLGVALVSSITWGSRPATDSSSEVRKARKASANCDIGAPMTPRFRCTAVCAAISGALRRMRGMSASDGRPEMASICATVRMPVSRLSRTKARTMPSVSIRIPSTSIMLERDCNVGATGGTALSMMSISVDSSPASMPAVRRRCERPS